MKNSQIQNVININYIVEQRSVHLMEIIAKFKHVQNFRKIFAKVLNSFIRGINAFIQIRNELFLPAEECLNLNVANLSRKIKRINAILIKVMINAQLKLKIARNYPRMSAIYLIMKIIWNIVMKKNVLIRMMMENAY